MIGKCMINKTIAAVQVECMCVCVCVGVCVRERAVKPAAGSYFWISDGAQVGSAGLIEDKLNLRRFADICSQTRRKVREVTCTPRVGPDKRVRVWIIRVRGQITAKATAKKGQCTLECLWCLFFELRAPRSFGSHQPSTPWHHPQPESLGPHAALPGTLKKTVQGPAA